MKGKGKTKISGDNELPIPLESKNCWKGGTRAYKPEGGEMV